MAAAAGLLILAIAFLPQMLYSKAGRNLIKMYLESRYRGQVWMTDWKTSWFGPTWVYQFSLTDPEGRQIKFTRLDSSVPFWKLLVGRYDLGKATITDLHVEYVIDYGDGTDTLDRLPNTPPAAGAAWVAPELPSLSGQIALKNGTFILTRGQIEDHRQFRTAFRSMKFAILEGSLDIARLDQPWKMRLEGTAGPDAAAGSFALSGEVDLGESGKLDWTKASAALQLDMQDVPNASSEAGASLAWLLLPVLSAEDYADALGPTLQRVEMSVKLADGKALFEKLEMTGRTQDGATARIYGEPVVDLTTRPRTLRVQAPLSASMPMTAGASHLLAYVNPFLRDAAAGQGWIDLHISDLALPLTGNQQKLTARGEMALRDIALASGQVLAGDAFPRQLTTQWQAIVGDANWSVTLQGPPTRFAVEHGAVFSDPVRLTIGGLPAVLEGRTTANGRLDAQVQITLPEHLRQEGETVAAALGGTIEQPLLHVATDEGLAEAVDRHLLSLRTRQSEHLLRLSHGRVEGMLQALDRMKNTDSTEEPRPGE